MIPDQNDQSNDEQGYANIEQHHWQLPHIHLNFANVLRAGPLDQAPNSLKSIPMTSETVQSDALL